MKPSHRVTVVGSIALLVCLLGTALTVRRVDQLRSGATLEDVLYIPSANILKRMSLGYSGLLADVYWTRAVQYFGWRHSQDAKQYKLLYPLLQITTFLDPKLVVAYQFGSVFLAQKPPNGAGMPEKAAELVEEGIRQNPGNWELYYNLGFLQYMELHDYEAAAKAFERGSEVPGAHPWLKILAARMAEHGGDLETARFMWTKTYETTSDKLIRANAIAHLRALQVDEDVSQLEVLVRLYRERTGRLPSRFAELVAAGWLRGTPVDPLGYAYKLTPNGRVEVRFPDNLPFIKKGLPFGKEAATVPRPESNQ